MVALGATWAYFFGMPCTKNWCARREPHLSHGTEHCVRLIRASGIPMWGWWPLGWDPQL